MGRSAVGSINRDLMARHHDLRTFDAWLPSRSSQPKTRNMIRYWNQEAQTATLP
jgi:hypothetical protein